MQSAGIEVIRIWIEDEKKTLEGVRDGGTPQGTDPTHDGGK